ncbi:MAG TPA: HNH endonuclease signature motif containing protein [Ktedonobacterales bacterium]|nr:HNH endonuclease signature motif containing protein [Ktedonobacterales bacterium]
MPRAPVRETPRVPARPRTVRTRAVPARPATRVPATRAGRASSARSVPRQHVQEQPRPQPQHLEWPESFDDWMIDIVRRRALRLNSGARRRGVTGSVRAVEMAHVLERSKDANGHWVCDICKMPVTLHDLSFDHIVALADGGEHAAYNLAPAHRKCNEIKGSEKAQQKAHLLDRWFDEWTNGSRSRTAS